MSKQTMLQKMLPSSVKWDKTFEAICETLQPYLDENMDDLVLRLLLYVHIDSLGEDLLNHLAYQFHVDFWDENLTVEQKRSLVKNSIKYHKHKGTPGAVEDLLSTIFHETWIKEWFEYGGNPYFFKVFTKDKITSYKTYEDLIRALNTVKNTRSWLEAIVLVREYIVTIYTAAIFQTTRNTTYYPYSTEAYHFDISYYPGIVKRSVIHSAYSDIATEFLQVRSLNCYHGGGIIEGKHTILR